MNYKDLRQVLSRRFDIPKERSIKLLVRSFTIAEKAIFFFFLVLFSFSGIAMAYKVSAAFLVEVPIRGGTFTEGIIGKPRFINPVLAISEADRNLTALVYSGLVRVTSDGLFENDLAEEILISEDRKTYTVRIRDNAQFHDGVSVTADDVVFTVQKILEPNIKSPKRGNWDGISVEKLDDRTVVFTLRQAYTPFMYNLTLGILPKHIWNGVSADEFAFSLFNTLPIGSGLYEIDRVEQNSGGIPDLYVLVPFENVHEERPFIENIVFKFYPNEEELISAFRNGAVESIGGISPERAEELNTEKSRIISSPLPRVFAVFFNQNQAKVLLNKEVRQALDLASPKEEIVQIVLKGYGQIIDGPLPAGAYDWAIPLDTPPFAERIETAKEILFDAGWEPNEETGILEKKSGSSMISLSFSISTGDAPELQAVAEKLALSWQELGAKVNVLVFETGDLNQNVIRPRNFDALLFGKVVSRDADLYPFWHSSQKNDPGLNIALYTNNQADKLLEDARNLSDSAEIEENYRAFAEAIKSDIPAVFLYTPSFIYVVPEKVKNVSLESLKLTQDRFLGIQDWYVETNKVWKTFSN